MRYLDRCYVRRCRVSAVRRAAGAGPSGALKGRRYRRILVAAALAQVLWATGALSRLWGEIGNLVQVHKIQERVLIRGGQNPFTGPGEAGDGAKIKEGVNILLDEKAIQIFRVEEKAGPGSD